MCTLICSVIWFTIIIYLTLRFNYLLLSDIIFNKINSILKIYRNNEYLDILDEFNKRKLDLNQINLNYFEFLKSNETKTKYKKLNLNQKVFLIQEFLWLTFDSSDRISSESIALQLNHYQTTELFISDITDIY